MTAVENWEEATRVGQLARELYPDALVLPYAENCGVEAYNFLKSGDLRSLLEELQEYRALMLHKCPGCPGPRRLRAVAS